MDASIALTMERVAKARSILVLDHPFFGALALRQQVVIDIGCRTAATDGKRLIFGPAFVATLTDHELLFLVAHEVMHSVYEHMYRRQGRKPRLWNVAGDYVINYTLVAEKIGSMPKKGLYSVEIFEAGGGTTDGIYAYLDQRQQEEKSRGPEPSPFGRQPKPEGGESGDGTGDEDGDDEGKPGDKPGDKGKPGEDETPGPGEPGGSLDDCMDGGQTPAEIAEAQAENMVAIAQAAQSAKMMGKLSAGLEELVRERLSPKVPWSDVMRDFVVSAKRDERTFARPARRFAAMGIYAPSKDGERMGRIALAIDRSGSQLGYLDQFAAEMRAIHLDMQPEAIDVIYFDSVVTHTESFGPDDEVELHPRGGGGTAFSPIFRWIGEQPDQPLCCVVLTDLECNDFGPAPDYPVLWVTTEKGKAPWGQIVEMN